MSDAETSPAATVAKVFDGLADTYDQTGVAFFRPVGQRLTTLLDPQPGQHALDIGCGRGAVTLPLATSVGPTGHVRAVDVSSAMTAATREVVDELGLTQVTVDVADASDAAALRGEGDGYDVIASSLVIFFIDHPDDVLRGWVSLLAPGGRIGLTTFDDLDDATNEIEELFVPWLPQGLLDARTSGREGPFASSAGMEELFRAAGARNVETVVEPAVLEFSDAEAWRRFSMSTGQRAMWRHVPEPERPGVFERAAAILESTRQGGPCRLVWSMRYTTGVR
jgi:ubiquinone/menaquinone biosynthesis C-methylase UbiE